MEDMMGAPTYKDPELLAAVKAARIAYQEITATNPTDPTVRLLLAMAGLQLYTVMHKLRMDLADPTALAVKIAPVVESPAVT
jgi:hypothetical protein